MFLTKLFSNNHIIFFKKNRIYFAFLFFNNFCFYYTYNLISINIRMLRLKKTISQHYCIQQVRLIQNIQL